MFMDNFLFLISSYVAKLISSVSRLMKSGYGYTWPGHAALKIHPLILRSDRINFSKGIFLISGTNGKTTTSKLIAHMLESRGLNVLSNTTGANLLNGIVSTILLERDLLGNSKADTGVFEVDEFSLPELLDHIKPTTLVLLNLSRDQLDRYGEVDIIFDKWQKAISKLDEDVNLVVFKDQLQFKILKSKHSDSFYEFDDDDYNIKHTKLRGSFNAKNINASVLACETLGFNSDALIKSLVDFDSAYGRGELILYKNKTFHVYLAKNPASMSHDLRLLSDFDKKRAALLFILNDKIPDGRDISWIYDIKAEDISKYTGGFKNVYVSGTRGLEMAIRLKYAGINIDEENIERKLRKAVEKIINNDEINEVLVFPNYSSMLELRKILTGKAIL